MRLAGQGAERGVLPPHSLMLSPFPSLHLGIGLLQNQPQAQTQNHQGQLGATLAPQGTAYWSGGSSTGVVVALLVG